MPNPSKFEANTRIEQGCRGFGFSYHSNFRITKHFYLWSLQLAKETYTGYFNIDLPVHYATFMGLHYSDDYMRV